MKPAAVFLQRLGHRAGAQSSLLRLLRQPAVRALGPVLVTGEDAWLSRECAREGIDCLVAPFPSSRSLAGRLYKNRAFGVRIARLLRDRQCRVVHGNDYLESLLAQEVGKALGAPTAVFLRNISMGAGDFAKYGCAGHALVAAAGDELHRRAQGWVPGLDILALQDGLEAGEFLTPRPAPARFPAEILVIGSPLPLKGWTDLAQALALLEDQPEFPAVRLDFTGTDPGLPALRKASFNFVGRVEGFRELVRNYHLALNPSRQDSFGIAALEVLAAGVPLLSTRSGAIEQVLEDVRYLARPREPAEMAERLLALARGWPGSALDVAAVQSRIRGKFTAERAAAELVAAYRARGII